MIPWPDFCGFLVFTIVIGVAPGFVALILSGLTDGDPVKHMINSNLSVNYCLRFVFASYVGFDGSFRKSVIVGEVAPIHW